MDLQIQWEMYLSGCNGHVVSFAIRGNNVLIDLALHPDLLKDYPKKRKLLKLMDKVSEGDYDAEQDIMDLIEKQCLEALAEYGKASEVAKHVTIQDYYSVKVICLELQTHKGELKLELRQCQKPKSELLPNLKASSLPPNHTLIPLIDAKHVRILPKDEQQPEELNIAQPSLVCIHNPAETTRIHHFKPTISEEMGLREMKILLDLKERQLNIQDRLSTISAIVHYSGQPSRILGFLLEHIDHENTLDNYIGDQKITTTLKDKWIKQIKTTVGSLHRRGIVWGDVKPSNVLIDREHKDAWIIDFGGGHTPEYVDEDKEHSIEGDLQGVSRMIEAMEQACSNKRKRVKSAKH